MSAHPPIAPRAVLFLLASGGFTTDDRCSVSQFYDQQRDATADLHDGDYFIERAEKAARRATRNLAITVFLVFAAIFIAKELL